MHEGVYIICETSASTEKKESCNYEAVVEGVWTPLQRKRRPYRGQKKKTKKMGKGDEMEERVREVILESATCTDTESRVICQ